MIILKTKRLIPRTWKEQDLDPMLAINQDLLVCEFLPKIEDRAATKALIQHFFGSYA